MHVHSQLGYLSFLAASVLGQDVTISAPTEVPDSASAAVDKSFLGLMFETTSWWSVAADPMSQTLIQNLVNKTGAPVMIRVGGTSGDQATYNASQAAGNSWPDNDNDLLAPVILGKQFSDGFKKVNGVRYIIEVPLANSSVENAVNFTQAMLQNICSSKLEAIEVGNEPNLYETQEYAGHKKRESYSPQDYVSELTTYINAIIDGVPALPQGSIFHVGSLADGSSWTAEQLFDAGLGSVASGRIKAFAQHYYQTNIPQELPTLREDLLNHSAVVAKFNRQPQTSLDYFQSAGIDTPLVFSESGSALSGLGDFNRVGDYERGIDAVLGSALWEVDWVLLAMSRGAARVNMNQCYRCNFASWWATEDTTNNAVFSQYYGLAMLADWLGLAGDDATTGGDLRVASLYDQATYPNVSPYAGYVDGKLDRVVVLDLNEWNSTETTARVERTFVVDVGADVTSAELRRLTGDGTDAWNQDGGITYAGTQYTADVPEGQAVGDETESVDVQDGKATFKMQASEAVLLTLHR